MSEPAGIEQPGPVTSPAEPIALGVQLIDTPAGQRLAVTLTLALPAAEAKVFAAAITNAAASMSTSGLTVAAGILPT